MGPSHTGNTNSHMLYQHPHIKFQPLCFSLLSSFGILLTLKGKLFNQYPLTYAVEIQYTNCFPLTVNNWHREVFPQQYVKGWFNSFSLMAYISTPWHMLWRLLPFVFSLRDTVTVSHGYRVTDSQREDWQREAVNWVSHQWVVCSKHTIYKSFPLSSLWEIQ